MKLRPVADAHCDFLYHNIYSGYEINAPCGKQAVSLPQLKAGGAALVTFAAWIDPDADVAASEQCRRLLVAYDSMMAATPDFVRFDKNFTPESGKIATVLTIEGGEAIDGSLYKLHEYYVRGVRAMTLTWNASNELASPAMSRLNRGLTRLGIKVVKHMEEIGMAIDLAHLSDAGIKDVLKLTDAPVVSSHTNARAVCKHKRSLSDELIKEIAKRGGVVCVNYYPAQLCSFGVASIADIVKHIMHMVKVGGVEAVALGSDFDGMTSYPRDIKNWADVPKLLEALHCAGLCDEEIDMIAYNNLSRFWKRFV